MVLKPAELTPLSANHLVRALVDAGLPAGVLNVVHGEGSVVGAALAEDSRVGALSFTGSTRVGLGLRDTLNARRARVQLEMGGKNGYLILDDADPAASAAVVAAGGSDPDGLVVRPTVITDLAHDDELVREEVFGPIIAVLEVADLDEGLIRINDSAYGLTAGICTR